MRRLFLTMLAIIFLIGIGGCEKYEFPLNEIEDPEIKSFVLRQKYNPQLKGDVHGTIGLDNKIVVIIDYEISDFTFKPTIKFSNGNTSTPAPNENIYGKKTTKYTVSNVVKHDTEEYDVEFHINKPLALLYLDVNGTRAYYNKRTEVYHIPVDQSKWDKPYIFEPIGTGGIQETFINDTKFTPGKEVGASLEFGKEYELKISNGSETSSAKFILSGIPIVSFEADYDVDNIALKGSERSGVSVSVYDPTEGGQYSVIDKYAGIRTRGGGSLNHPKKSYSLEFQNKGNKEENDIPLFGLRNDGDWILDGLVSDVARVRNRICTDIWNDMHTLSYIDSEPKAIPATRGRMTEVYFNGDYRGIYCVTERVDRKQLKLDEINGYLYKGESTCPHIRFNNYDENALPENGDERWICTDFCNERPWHAEFGWQAEYPQYPYTKWDPMIDFVKFVCDSDDETFIAGVSKQVDIDNLVDYFIFINVIHACDNQSNNTFMGMYNRDGLNGFFYVPWDLDRTLGRSWGETPVDVILSVPNNLYKRVIITNSGDFGTKVQKRWDEVKNGVCSKESIIARLRAYQVELDGSGAYERDMNKWDGTVTLETEIDYMVSWIDEHIDYVDKYIQDWDSNVEKLKLQP